MVEPAVGNGHSILSPASFEFRKVLSPSFWNHALSNTEMWNNNLRMSLGETPKKTGESVKQIKQIEIEITHTSTHTHTKVYWMKCVL